MGLGRDIHAICRGIVDVRLTMVSGRRFTVTDFQFQPMSKVVRYCNGYHSGYASHSRTLARGGG
jgi:hypothetical protein